MGSVQHEAPPRGGLFLRVSHQLTALVALVVMLGVGAMTFTYFDRQRDHILDNNADAMREVTETVIRSLRSVMLAGYADIAQVYADNLKHVAGVVDFRILRTDGTEAFRDNRTIDEVNDYRGDDDFDPREKEGEVRVLAADDAQLGRVVDERQVLSYAELGPLDESYLTFLAPIEMSDGCDDCHQSSRPVRGILKLTTSLGPVESDIRETRHESIAVLIIAGMLILVITVLLVRTTVLRPLHVVSTAMADTSRGHFDREVPVLGNDELADMARSFNTMVRELRSSYIDLETEQNKLATLILSASEGIVSTNPDGRVVLTNPAACGILAKSREAIEIGGFEQLFDDPGMLRRWLADPNAVRQGHVFVYGEKILHANVGTIRDQDGVLLGKTALFRDMTREHHLEEQLRKLSRTDGLTGLYNRRYLNETLLREFERSRLRDEPLSIAMLDIDHFKRFNDTHGHEMGDRVLRAVAEATLRCARKIDVACRYGGEELVIALPNTPVSGALRFAERLREEIAGQQVHGLSITASLGVACTTEGLVSPDALIAAADRRLYIAKRGGRNRTVASDDAAPG